MNEIDFMALAEVFSGRPWIICLFIFLFTFVLEDVATVSAALLSSYDYVPPQAAFICLLAGIILGDLGLYGLGYGASRFQWAKRILERKKVVLAQHWLEEREVMAVLAARFVPGARLPTYTAMGFCKLSFPKFIGAILIASVLWTSFLFITIYNVGEVFVDQLESWQWPMAFIMVLFVIIAPRFIHHKVKRND